MSHLSSPDICEAAGISYRQLDYWIRQGAIPVTPEMQAHGSGRPRLTPDWYVPRLILLGRLQGLTDRHLSVTLLRNVFDHYDNGQLELAPGIHITWTTQKDQP